MGGNLTIFDKDHNTAEGRSRRFLQPNVRLRYNYYVQLVATKRDWIFVPNVNFWSTARWPAGGRGWKLVVNKAVCESGTIDAKVLISTRIFGYF